MKKLLCLLLCACMLLSFAVPAAAKDDEEPTEPLEVSLVTHSNLLNTKTLGGVYWDKMLYMHPHTLAALLGCTAEVQDKTAVFNWNDIFTVTLREKDEDVPTLLYKGTLYVSAPHMLRRYGATVGFGQDEKAQVHMMVSTPYSVLELLKEYSDANGHRFCWWEAEGKWVDPQDILYLAALDTVLLGYDANVLGYAIPGRGENVAVDIYTDILLELLRNESTNLIALEDPRVDLFGDCSDLLDLSSDWISEVMDWIEEDTFSTTFHNTMGKMMDASGEVVSVAGEYMTALATARQFANLSSTQKDLLDNTLNKVSADDPSRKELPELFTAAKKASNYMDEQYDAHEGAAWEGVNKLMDDAIDSWLFTSNPVTFAWESLTTIAKLDPLASNLLDAEKNVTFAAESDNIRVLADRMIDQSISKINANKLYIGKRGGESVYEKLRYEIILSLKASLTSRLLLMESGFLTDSAASEMKVRAMDTAYLLNKAQNACYVPMGWAPTVDEDLTWIKYLAGYGRYGMAVEADGCSYYWKMPSGGYESGGTLAYFPQIAQPVLVRRDAKGKETELFTGKKELPFGVTGQYLLADEGGTVVSYDKDGKNRQVLYSGYLEAVSENGRFAVCSSGTTVTILDLNTGTKFTVTNNGSFERLWEGVVYYTVYQSDRKAAQKGQLELRAVNVDGSDDRLMARTAPDLYDGSFSMSDAIVAQMHFDDAGLYFSYGSIAGSGAMFQQGKVMYVPFDGSAPKVVAGQNGLVGADFTVHKDGTVTAPEDYYPYFETYRTSYPAEGGIAWIDPKSGATSVILSTSEYARSDVAYTYVETAYVEVTESCAYVLAHYGVEDEAYSIGWRTGYKRNLSVLYQKDLKTGEITELNIIR